MDSYTAIFLSLKWKKNFCVTKLWIPVPRSNKEVQMKIGLVSASIRDHTNEDVIRLIKRETIQKWIPKNHGTYTKNWTYCGNGLGLVYSMPFFQGSVNKTIERFCIKNNRFEDKLKDPLFHQKEGSFLSQMSSQKLPFVIHPFWYNGRRKKEERIRGVDMFMGTHESVPKNRNWIVSWIYWPNKTVRKSWPRKLRGQKRVVRNGTDGKISCVPGIPLCWRIFPD